MRLDICVRSLLSIEARSDAKSVRGGGNILVVYEGYGRTPKLEEELVEYHRSNEQRECKVTQYK